MFFLRKSKFSGDFFLERAKLVVKSFLIRLAVLTVVLATIIWFLIGSDSGRHPAAMTVTVLLVTGAMTWVVVSAGEFFIGGYNRVAEMADYLDEDEYRQACEEAKTAEPAAKIFIFTSSIVYCPFGLLARISEIEKMEAVWLKNNKKSRGGEYKKVILRFKITGGKSCELVFKYDEFILALDKEYDKLKWKMQQLNSRTVITESGK